MTPTDNEKKLSIRLHELLKAKGQLPEIREGDWYLDTRHSMAPFGPFLCTGEMIPDLRDIFILLWSWSRCREWLEEKGEHRIAVELSVGIDSAIDVYFGTTGKSYKSTGQTDAEAAMAVCIQVAEEKKNGK